jgi:hypothetical protein
MEISKLLLLLCSVFMYVPLKAQLVKVEAGAALSTQTWSEYGKKNTGEIIIGYEAGVRLDFPISYIMSVQPGLLFTQTGATFSTAPQRHHTESSSQTNITHQIQVPVSLVLRFGISPENKAMFGAGIYGAYALYGKQQLTVYNQHHETTTVSDISFGNTATDNYKRIDYGLCVASGIELNSGLSICGYYTQGLHNLSPSVAAAKKINNQQFIVTLGYYVNRKTFAKKKFSVQSSGRI